MPSRLSPVKTAVLYGVSNDLVTLIRRGKAWKHLNLSGRQDVAKSPYREVNGIVQKRCACCHSYKSPSEFSPVAGGTYSYCRPCAALRQKERTLAKNTQRATSTLTADELEILLGAGRRERAA